MNKPKHRLLYVADNLYPDFTGGAEMNDYILLHNLQNSGVKLSVYRSPELVPKHVEMYIKRGYHILISNFVTAHAATIKTLMAHPKSYSIIEHDHKYLITRDPSPFPEFKAPPDKIINRKLYLNAKCVFAQSNKHKEIIDKNLNTNNVISLGMSMYFGNNYDFIEEMIDRRENLAGWRKNTAGVGWSTNPTKNLQGSEQYCIDNNIEYEVFGQQAEPDSPHAPQSWEAWVESLSRYDRFVYIPKVFETFNRVLLEARMLGLQITTTDKNGCLSEEWFSKYKGKELIEEAKRLQMQAFLKLAKGMFEETDPNTDEKIHRDSGDITVILNAYRRPNNIKLQVEALRNQTIPPKEIWLWINAHEDNLGFDFSKLGVDKIFHNDHNWKFYGRFAAALLADTEYVAIYDDDTVPGADWHKNCLETMSKTEGILGSAGIILKSDKYINHDRCGWPTQNAETTEVDLVGHAWFFKREWLRYLWQEKPTTWDNGEDIQFAFMAKIHGGIPTYCPPHPPNNKKMWGSILGNELGIDNKATSTNSAVSHQQFFSERDECVVAGLNSGWETVNKVKA